MPKPGIIHKLLLRDRGNFSETQYWRESSLSALKQRNFSEFSALLRLDSRLRQE
jgi:hypothetical protein